jgi:hypothetical protein
MATSYYLRMSELADFLIRKKHHVLAIAIFFIASMAIVSMPAQTSASSHSSVVHQLYLDDQKDRATASPDRAKHDQERLVRVKALVASNGLVTGEDFHDAAFIFQHSLKADDYLEGHILAMEAIVRGDTRSKWIAAASLDRYLLAIGKPQVFGNQINGTCTKDNVCTDTQEPYNDLLVTDKMRKDFCVWDRATQRKNLEAYKEGRDYDPIPPGCTR